MTQGSALHGTPCLICPYGAYIMLSSPGVKQAHHDVYVLCLGIPCCRSWKHCIGCKCIAHTWNREITKGLLDNTRMKDCSGTANMLVSSQQLAPLHSNHSNPARTLLVETLPNEIQQPLHGYRALSVISCCLVCMSSFANCSAFALVNLLCLHACPTCSASALVHLALHACYLSAR